MHEEMTSTLDSVRCYASAQGYRFSVLLVSDYRHVCPHTDKFFLRHCITAEVLNESEYTLFLDADIGVVNPKRRVEEFIEPGKEIVFYDRFYNFEIMAGTYLVHNSTWSKTFLMGWANYEFRLPNSFHGSDNGAIHAYLLEVLFPTAQRYEHELCMQIYYNSIDFETLFAFESCTRILLGRLGDFGSIRILEKGKGWARDVWLTNSKWSSERDFMIHDWKLNSMVKYTQEQLPISPVGSSRNWYNPFNGTFDIAKCYRGNTTWNYDTNLMTNAEEIDDELNRLYVHIEKLRVKSYADIARLLKLQ